MPAGILAVALAVWLAPVTRTSEIAEPLPLTQRQACAARFTEPVVAIEAGGRSRGTGFLVSADGFILTAAHVVLDKEVGRYFSTILVKLPNGAFRAARPVSLLTAESFGEDFAVLKVDGETKLPFLPLGTAEDIASGSDVAIIGYPFSAVTVEAKQVSAKFCLAATIAAFQLTTVSVEGTRTVGRRIVPFKNDIKVDVIYFQGPSVKGISGSPLISKDSGYVIGIVNLKLTGIGKSLSTINEGIARGPHAEISTGGVGAFGTIGQILTVLDNQLANGLGAAVGIDAAKHALAQAQRQAQKQR